MAYSPDKKGSTGLPETVAKEASILKKGENDGAMAEIVALFKTVPGAINITTEEMTKITRSGVFGHHSADKLIVLLVAK